MQYAQLSVDDKNSGQHFFSSVQRTRHCTKIIVCHFKIALKKSNSTLCLNSVYSLTFARNRITWGTLQLWVWAANSTDDFQKPLYCWSQWRNLSMLKWFWRILWKEPGSKEGWWHTNTKKLCAFEMNLGGGNRPHFKSNECLVKLRVKFITLNFGDA